jgi:hypothetical protein
MNRRIAAILGAVTFGLGLGAFAGDEPLGQPKPGTPDKTTPAKPTPQTPTPTEPSQAPDLGTHEGHTGQKGMPSTGVIDKTSGGQVDAMTGKHLAMVNLYLGQAILNTKAIDSLVSMDVSVKESQVKEATRNLDLSLKNAMMHVGHLKKMNDPSFTRLTELDRALKDVKTNMTRLRKAKDADIDGQIDQIGTSLTDAEHIFRDMAKTANFSILEDMSLGGTVPVRGTDQGIEPQQEQDKTMENNKNVAPPKHDTDMLPEPARPESPPSSPTPKYR